MFFKKPRIKDIKYLDFVATLPCMIYGIEDGTVSGHHLLKTGMRGIGLKSPDDYVVPLSYEAHHYLHNSGLNEDDFFSENGITNQVEIAQALYGHWVNKQYEAARELVLRRGK